MGVGGSLRAKDALRPIEFIVSLALTLVGVFLAVVVVLLIGSALGVGHVDATVGTWGDPHPCLQVPQRGFVIGAGNNADSIGGTSIQGLKPGVHLGVPEVYTICVDHLSAADQTLLSVPALISGLWSLGFLWLTRRLIRRARRHGLFTHEVARASTQLGWYVLGGWAIVDLAGGVLRAMAYSHFATGYSVSSGVVGNLSWSWPIVIAGFGVISFGRVIQQTVPLREEIEATI